jgi:hypothetical protein
VIQRFAPLFTALALAGCPAPGPSVDAALPPGSFPCGAWTCVEGDVCAIRSGGGGVDAGPTADCLPRPQACGSQGDCVGTSCAQACVDAACGPAVPGYRTVALTVRDGGRVYECRAMADAS